MAKFYWLKFDNQKISKKIYRISKFKAKCNLGHKWVWHDKAPDESSEGAGWYRYITWKCTDPDNNQFGRKIGDKLYEFRQDMKYPDGKVVKVRETIDLNEYSNKEIDEYLSCYGWSIEILKKDHSPEDAEWLYAECIFEQTLN